jgi:hypothetical protein
MRLLSQTVKMPNDIFMAGKERPACQIKRFQSLTARDAQFVGCAWISARNQFWQLTMGN